MYEISTSFNSVHVLTRLNFTEAVDSKPCNELQLWDYASVRRGELRSVTGLHMLLDWVTGVQHLRP